MLMRNLVLAVVVFIVILVALTFGEVVLAEVFSWVSYLTGLVIHNFADVYYAIAGFLSRHSAKVLLALVLTVPITLWIIRKQGANLDRATNRRKVAIVLAFFLGWLGVHRFYLNQIGIGLVYLVIFYFFTPLAVILGLIDGIRYLLMSDQDFNQEPAP